MKKIMFILLALIMLSVPLVVSANDGVTNLYCSWFNDSSGLNGTNDQFRYTNWINLCNTFSNSTAIVKVTYYDKNGSVYSYNGQSSFEHQIPPKGFISFRPYTDLQHDTTTEFSGSYIVESESGSIIGSNVYTVKAGPALPGLGTEYNLNDVVAGYTSMLDTTGSNYLITSGYMQRDSDGGGPKTLGDFDTTFYLNNPGEKEAKVTLSFYDTNGSPLSVYVDGNHQQTGYSRTETIGSHATLALKALEDLGINGTSNVNFGMVVADCSKGNLIGQLLVVSCEGGLTATTYRHLQRQFMKRHMQ